MKKAIYSMLLIGVILQSCGECPTKKKSENPIIFVTISPLASLAESISGGRFAVEILLPPGAEPHFYEPKPAEVEKLSKAVLLFYVGEGLDDWASKMALVAPNPPRVISVSFGVPRLPLLTERARLELEKKGKMPAFGAPHIWTDPMVVADMIIPIMMRAIIAADPQNEKSYIDNARKLSDRIRKFSAEAEKKLAHLKGYGVMLNHGSFSYFCKRYGLEVVEIIEPIPDMEPSPKDIEEILKIGRAKNAIAILSEPMASGKTAQIISKELSIPIVSVDPIGKPGESYIDLMNRNIKEILKIPKP